MDARGKRRYFTENANMKKTDYPRIERRILADLKPAEWNPRKISADARRRLKASLLEFGNIQPIVLNVKTGTLIAGHQRVQEWIECGETQTDVWCVYLTATQEKAANVALNRYAGEFDPDKLSDIMKSLDALNIDLDLTGFTPGERSRLPSKTVGKAASKNRTTAPEHTLSYSIVFGDQDQKEKFEAYIGKLRKKYPDADSIAEMILEDNKKKIK